MDEFIAGEVELIKKFLTRSWEQVFNTKRNSSKGKGILTGHKSYFFPDINLITFPDEEDVGEKA